MRPFLRILSLVLLTALASGLLGGLAFAGARQIGSSLGRAAQPGSPVIRSLTPTSTQPQAAPSLTPSPEVTEESVPTPVPTNPDTLPSQATLTPWDGAGRITVLVMGLDYRDWEQTSTDEPPKPSRSDTMMLLTLDPMTKEAGILSIPRDLWVAIPGYYNAKINTAHYLGQSHKLPGGGPGLAVRTVEEFIGVPVNYYAVVDFLAFERFIDELGGIEVDVPARIRIDMRGSGPETQRWLNPGINQLNGEEALAYARNRSTEGGDFDRADRQQQVIFAIRDRILRLDMLPTLITKAPTLYDELKAGINTNLPLDDAIRLALLGMDVRKEDIKQGVINEKYILQSNAIDVSGNRLAVLIPIPDKINVLRDEIFNSNGALAPQTPGDLEERVTAEGASLGVFNGTNTSGLETTVGAYLEQHGVSVAETGRSSAGYGATTLVDHTGNPYLVRYLTDLYSLQAGRIKFEYDPEAPLDVELHLDGTAASVDLP